MKEKGYILPVGKEALTNGSSKWVVTRDGNKYLRELQRPTTRTSVRKRFA